VKPIGPQYLGDGVYAEFDGFQVKLTCDCMSEPNAIFLEDRVMLTLIRLMEAWWERRIKIEGVER